MTTFRYAYALVAIIGLISLTACGGGDDQIPLPLPNSPESVSLTGAQMPQETPANQAARAPGIHARSDHLVASSAYGETSFPEYPAYVAGSSCTGTRCRLSHAASGVSLTLENDDIITSTQGTHPLLTKHGITTLVSQYGYGAWMDHSGFSVETGRIDDEGTWYVYRFGLAGGDLTGSRPSGAATWTGIMVGTPQKGDASGNYLQGDASLTFDMTNNQIDAMFNNIKDLDRVTAHSTTMVQFDDIPVTASGTYDAGTQGNRIQGGFYGPGHAEAAGTFEQAGIVGAFGTKRQ